MVGKDDFGWLSDVSKGPPAFWSQKVSCLLQTWHPLPQLKRWGTPTRIMSAFLLSNRVIYKCKYEYKYTLQTYIEATWLSIITIYFNVTDIIEKFLFENCSSRVFQNQPSSLHRNWTSPKSSGLVHEKGATNTPHSWSGYIILQVFFAMSESDACKNIWNTTSCKCFTEVELAMVFCYWKSTPPFVSFFVRTSLTSKNSPSDQSQRIGVYGETSVARRYIFRSQTLPTSPVSFWFVVSNGLKQ